MSIRMTGMAIALLCLASTGAAHADARVLFEKRAKIEYADQGIFAEVEIPAEVLLEASENFADVRVFHRGGKELRYAVLQTNEPGQEQEAPVRLALKPSEASRRKNPRGASRGDLGIVESFSFEALPEAPENRRWLLKIIPKAQRGDIVRNVTLTQGGETQETTVFRFENGTSKLVVPVQGGQPLMIVASGQGPELAPAFELVSEWTARPKPKRTQIELPILSIEQDGSRTLVRCRRGWAVRPETLHVQSSTELYSRLVQVFDVGPQLTDRAQLGSQRVVAVESARSDTVSISAASSDELLIEIENGDNAPLEDIKVYAKQPQQKLVMEAHVGAMWLYYGGGRTLEPDYDLGAALAAIETPNMRIARISDHEPNPSFDGGPALSYLMHPGKKVAARRYAYEASLTVKESKEGLTRILLPSEVVAHTKTQLRDLRIVDTEGRQWPYLLADADSESRVELSVSKVREGNETVYSLDTKGQLEATALHIEVDSDYVDRAYSIVARGQAPPKEIGQRSPRIPKRTFEGRLVRRPTSGNLKGPIVVPLPAENFRAVSYELRIVDGDETPLDLSVSASVAQQAVYLVAKPGKYRALFGFEDSERPVYEIERARDLVLAVRSEDTALSAKQANPQFDPPSAYAKDGVKDIAVWAVLILSVLLLGFWTIRSASAEPDALTETEASETSTIPQEQPSSEKRSTDASSDVRDEEP